MYNLVTFAGVFIRRDCYPSAGRVCRASSEPVPTAAALLPQERVLRPGFENIGKYFVVGYVEQYIPCRLTGARCLIIMKYL